MARELTIMEMVKELRRRYNCDLAVIEGRFGLYFYKFEDLKPTQVRNLYNKSKSQFKDWSITPVVLDLVGPGTYEGSAILITKDKPHFGEVKYLYHEWWYKDNFNKKGDYCGNSLVLCDRVGSYSKGWRIDNSTILWFDEENNIYCLSDNRPPATI